VDNIFVLVIVAVTSAITYFGTQRNNRAKIHAAIRAFFEYAGTFSLFFVANIVFGFFIILLIRTFTPLFVALYALENVLLLILSAAQAFVFHRSWKR
jgi:hypothetical protein